MHIQKIRKTVEKTSPKNDCSFNLISAHIATFILLLDEGKKQDLVFPRYFDPSLFMKFKWKTYLNNSKNKTLVHQNLERLLVRHIV